MNSGKKKNHVRQLDRGTQRLGQIEDRIRGRMDRRQTESEEEWIEDRQNQRKNG